MASPDDSDVALTTGMKSLDNQLEGNGLFAGTIVTIVAPPNSSGEHLLYNMVGGRDTHYLSTVRDVETIKETLRLVSPQLDKANVEYIDDYLPTEKAQQNLLDADLPEHGSIVVDPVNFFERDEPSAYRDFLKTFRKRVKETGSIGLLHANVEPNSPDLRWLTLQMSDAIFVIKHRENHEKVEDHLLIPKLYGRQHLDERTFKLPHSLKIDVGTKESIKA